MLGTLGRLEVGSVEQLLHAQADVGQRRAEFVRRLLNEGVAGTIGDALLCHVLEHEHGTARGQAANADAEHGGTVALADTGLEDLTSARAPVADLGEFGGGRGIGEAVGDRLADELVPGGAEEDAGGAVAVADTQVGLETDETNPKRVGDAGHDVVGRGCGVGDCAALGRVLDTAADAKRGEFVEQAVPGIAAASAGLADVQGPEICLSRRESGERIADFGERAGASPGGKADGERGDNHRGAASEDEELQVGHRAGRLASVDLDDERASARHIENRAAGRAIADRVRG